MRISEATFEEMTGGSLLGDCVLSVYYARVARKDNPGSDLFFPSEKRRLISEIVAEWRRRVGDDLPDEVFPFKDEIVLYCWVRTRKANNVRKVARAIKGGIEFPDSSNELFGMEGDDNDY